MIGGRRAPRLGLLLVAVSTLDVTAFLGHRANSPRAFVRSSRLQMTGGPPVKSDSSRLFTHPGHPPTRHPCRTPARKGPLENAELDGEALDDGDVFAADPKMERSWLTRFSVLNGMACFFEEALADFPADPDRKLGREVLRRTAVAVRKLESEWENFQSEVQSDVDGLMLLDKAKLGAAASAGREGREPATRPINPALRAVDPSLRRARRQLQAALRVLQVRCFCASFSALHCCVTAFSPFFVAGLTMRLIMRLLSTCRC
ncbi:hypothetical protein T492DRAFT_437273 [Pavlovales sp. CCMP2436]|nr:hypothetical protein T492DRAFT_437273 [Pavlovales sp. CCMP2436]